MELSRLHFAAAATAALYAAAAEAAPTLDGAQMGWAWALPFAGVLLSIATGPLLFRRLWHHHYGKIAAGWALATLLPLGMVFGADAAFAAFLHIALADYLSFIVLLLALYTVAGGLLISGTLGGRPWSNTAVLAFGTAIASLVGTTGAAMILVRPLMRANARRAYNAHVRVFHFSRRQYRRALSPVGDPPLLVGFLRGVDFLWPAMNLWRPTLCAAVIVLALFVAIDLWFARRDARSPMGKAPVRIKGIVVKSRQIPFERKWVMT